MRLHCGIILMKRIPAISRESPENPGTSGDAQARPWDPPRGRQETASDHKNAAPEALRDNVYFENRAHFGRPCGRQGGGARSKEWVDAHGGRFPIAAEPGSPV